MATLLLATGESREVAPNDGRSFTLSELQAFVGGYIEVFYVPDGRVIFMDEDGKRHQRPINYAATAMVRHRLMPGDVIVGDVILCTRREAGEEAGPEE